MISELNVLPMISELTVSDFDMFKKAVRTLVAKTFIIRGIQKEEELYDFVIRNIALFDAYFLCMDAIVMRDESLGVISFRGDGDTRLRLNREETCALLVARLLYEEKRAELTLTAFPTVTVEDFIQKYNALTDDVLKKTRIAELLRRLQTHKLIDVTSNEITDTSGVIILYPSITMSVDRDSIDEMIAGMKSKTRDDTNHVENEAVDL
ncbi:MAG: hypothetical protein Ta2B_00810 [Termitinemataceae bacterium]|nr:MAG: hypothetical protein Ta2B_00810 [Termitinemataceae bacterium]